MVVFFRATCLAFCVLAPCLVSFTSAQVQIDLRAKRPLTSLQQDMIGAIRSDTSLVVVPVQVSTREGSPIVGLGVDAFRVFEEGAEQSVSYFEKDDAPVSIGLLFDSSASMTDKKKKAIEAAAAFFRTAGAEDEFFLIEFDESPRLKVPFTTGTAEIFEEIKHTRPFGRTSLYDAIYLGLQTMKHARHERKALVIVSDGADNRSHRNFVSTRNSLAESDVQLYAMGIFAPPQPGDVDATPHDDDPGMLSKLAELTGGKHFAVELDNLSEISSRIGLLLRNRYLLGYTSSDTSRDGKYRRLTVNMRTPAPESLRLQFRKGYYAPAQ